MNIINQTIITSLLIISAIYLIFLNMTVIEKFCIGGVVGTDCRTTTQNEIQDITKDLTSIDNSVNKVIQQSCVQKQVASNTLHISGSTINNTNISQQNIIKNVCSLQSIFQSDIKSKTQDEIAATVVAHAKSTGSLLGGAPASSRSIHKSLLQSKKYINNKQLLNSIKKCVNNLDLNNLLTITNSNISGAAFIQVNEHFKKCLASDKNTVKLSQDMEKKIDKMIESSTEAQGGDVVKSVGDALSDVIESIVGDPQLFWIIVGGVGILYVLNQDKSSSSKDMQAITDMSNTIPSS